VRKEAPEAVRHWKRGTYREQGSNLHVQRTPDPKSGASTNSAIPAQGVKTRPQVLRTARLGYTMRRRERAARFKDAVFSRIPRGQAAYPFDSAPHEKASFPYYWGGIDCLSSAPI
jgi:hypothetical protein